MIKIYIIFFGSVNLWVFIVEFLPLCFICADEKIMKKSGRVLLTSELGDEYGFVDINGKLHYTRGGILHF